MTKQQQAINTLQQEMKRLRSGAGGHGGRSQGAMQLADAIEVALTEFVIINRELNGLRVMKQQLEEHVVNLESDHLVSTHEAVHNAAQAKKLRAFVNPTVAGGNSPKPWSPTNKENER